MNKIDLIIDAIQFGYDSLEWGDIDKVEMFKEALAAARELKALKPVAEREWVGLTIEEVNAIRKDIFEKYQKALLVTRDVTSENDYSAFNFYRAIEDKLRSKND
jgi:hypothetical protein